MRDHFKLSHNELIIDVDVKSVWDEFRLLKAVHQFNWIPRKIFKTNHGYHIKFPTLKHSIILRTIFEDDPRRLNIDVDKMVSNSNLYANVCFRSTEKYEVKNV